MVQIGKHLFERILRDHVTQHRNTYPAVRTYSSDGTPLLLNSWWRKMLGDSVINRHRTEFSEYVLEKAFIKTRTADCQSQKSVVLRDPILPCFRSRVGRCSVVWRKQLPLGDRRGSEVPSLVIILCLGLRLLRLFGQGSTIPHT